MDARHGDSLRDWIEQTEAAGLAPLSSFARGLRQDYDAVAAGISLLWNSGPVEGHVNRIKMINARCSGELASPCCASGFCSCPDHRDLPSAYSITQPDTEPEPMAIDRGSLNRIFKTAMNRMKCRHRPVT
ncbi:transposase [Saccharothrix longispora]